MRPALAALLVSIVAFAAALLGSRASTAEALSSGGRMELRESEPAVDLAMLEEQPIEVQRSRPVDEPVKAAVVRARPRVVVIRPVDRSGAPLPIDHERARGGEVPERLELQLWTLDGERRMDDRDYLGGPVTLEFKRNEMEGFVTIAERWLSSGEKLRWFIDPDQPNVRRDVIGKWRGIEVKGGDPEVVFALGGEVRGRVERGRYPAARALTVRVRPAGETGSLPWNVYEVGPVAAVQVKSDGTFHVRDVDAGPCRVEVVAGDLPLAVVKDVEVNLEEVARDARLASIEIEVDLVRMTVVDALGERVEGAFAHLVSEGYAEHVESGAESLEVHVPRALADDAFLVVGAPGHVPVRLEPRFTSRTVVLDEVVRIAPRAEPEFKADIGSHGFWLRLRRTDARTGVERFDAVELPFDWSSGDPKAIDAPGPGRYELDVMVRMRMGSRFGFSPNDRWQPTGVFVNVTGANGPLTLTIPSDIQSYSETMWDR